MKIYTPAVSIIMPAYNTAAFIGEALDSVFRQTFTDYEVIVINDGSPDTPALRAAVAPYLDRLVYLEQENGGSSAARNAGLARARGRFVALLDSDDVWEPEYLAVHVGMLEADESIAVVFPNARLFGATPRDGKAYMDVNPLDGEITFARLVANECYVWGGVTARREAFECAGNFDVEQGSGEDLDLWLRVLHQGGRIVYHRQVLAGYRQRAGSHTADPVHLYRNYTKLLDKIQRAMSLTDEETATVKHQREHAQAMLDLYEGKRAFFDGDTETAVAKITTANRVLASRKLQLAVFCLQRAPRLLLRVYDLRDRYVLRVGTRV